MCWVSLDLLLLLSIWIDAISPRLLAISRKPRVASNNLCSTDGTPIGLNFDPYTISYVRNILQPSLSQPHPMTYHIQPCWITLSGCASTPQIHHTTDISYKLLTRVAQHTKTLGISFKTPTRTYLRVEIRATVVVHDGYNSSDWKRPTRLLTYHSLMRHCYSSNFQCVATQNYIISKKRLEARTCSSHLFFTRTGSTPPNKHLPSTRSANKELTNIHSRIKCMREVFPPRHACFSALRQPVKPEAQDSNGWKIRNIIFIKKDVANQINKRAGAVKRS